MLEIATNIVNYNLFQFLTERDAQSLRCVSKSLKEDCKGYRFVPDLFAISKTGTITLYINGITHIFAECTDMEIVHNTVRMEFDDYTYMEYNDCYLIVREPTKTTSILVFDDDAKWIYSQYRRAVANAPKL
jgi:hypothetical protein